jgi:DNA-binding transcriptional regulator YiaG
VPVVVWKLTPNCERALDLYEGVSTGHYFKEMMRVSVAGQEVEAMVYIMNLEADYSTPSRGYFEAVKQGFEAFGLDVRKLYQALKAHEVSGEVSTLKAYRLSRGLTQAKLAAISGLTIKRVQQYEQGARVLSKAHTGAVLALAEALGVEVRQLLA